MSLRCATTSVATQRGWMVPLCWSNAIRFRLGFPECGGCGVVGAVEAGFRSRDSNGGVADPRTGSFSSLEAESASQDEAYCRTGLVSALVSKLLDPEALERGGAPVRAVRRPDESGGLSPRTRAWLRS